MSAKGSDSQLLECGKVINTHGIAGKIKLESWCDSPEILASVGTLWTGDGKGGYLPMKVKSASVFKRFVIAEIAGIDSIEKAESLKGKTVFADRSDIPLEEGSYFIADLIGLDVYDADTGVRYGTVSEVFNAGASDIYTVSTDSGERMIPAVPEFIVSVDLEKGIAVKPIGGMFD